jgi:hypothetical protein
MRRKIFFYSILVSINLIPCTASRKKSTEKSMRKSNKVLSSKIDFSSIEAFEFSIRYLYKKFDISDVLDYKLFRLAVLGYTNMYMQLKNRAFITIVDYSRPSTDKRLYILDIKRKKLLVHTFVAHGRKSGGNYAVSFSNERGTGKTSIGFFRTAETYFGRHGYSLRMDGMEEYNDNARERNIVVHGADYVSSGYIAANGMLGGSGGCPALPLGESRAIIENIKGGSCFFIYHNNENYKYGSRYLDAGKAMRQYKKNVKAKGY